MRVAFVIPFVFERFFHDCTDIHNDPDAFEDKFLAKRNTWHMNWCRAMSEGGMEVILFHLSKYGKTVRYYTHQCGIPMIRIPVTGFDKRSGEEYSDILFEELDVFKPDLVFSVTHFLKSRYDMYDRIVTFCNKNNIPVVARNPHSDTRLLIFRQTLSNSRHIAQSFSLKSFKGYLKTGYLIVKGVPLYIKEYRKYIIKRKSLRRSDLIVVQTKTDLNVLYEKFKIDPGKGLLLPKPVDQRIFHEIPRPDAAGILGLPSSAVYLLHVNNLVNRKGCDLIIRVLPEVKKFYPGIKLIITGNGEERQYLEKLSADEGVSDCVIFTGHIDHSLLPLYYNLAEAMLLPTDLDVEGQPNAVIEALACKTIPVVSDLPGPAEVVTCSLGLLIKPKNEQSLNDAIIKVLSGNFRIDPVAYKRFLTEYSFENMGKCLNQLFSNILSAKKCR